MDPLSSDPKNNKNQQEGSSIPDLSYLLNDSSSSSTPSNTIPDNQSSAFRQSSNDGVGSINESSNITNNTSDIPPTEPPPPMPPLKKNNRFSLSMIALFVGIVLLLVTTPIIGFFTIQQQQLADIRNRAYVITTPPPTICSSSYPTAQGCFGKNVGSNCDYPPNYICKQTSILNGQVLCACLSKNPNNNSPVPTPVPTPPRNATCANASESCEQKACCAGLVCQGVIGSRVCQQPQIPPENQCRVGGNTTALCNRILAFRCNQWFASECLDNPAFFNDMQSAISYVNGCGQIDIVCNSGPNENKLCGDFTIYKDRCGQSNPQPTQPQIQPTQPPQPTTPIDQCQNLKIYKNGQLLMANQYATIRPGDQLILAAVGPKNATQARFIINNGIPQATTQRNNANEFIITYTVPNVSEPTQIAIRAEVFINGQWR